MTALTHPFFQPSPHDQAVLWRTGKAPRPSVRSLHFRDHPRDVWAGGTIITVDDTTFALEFGTNAVAMWPNTGIPIRQLLIDVQTNDRDLHNRSDDGLRRVWIRQEDVYYPNGSLRPGTKYGEFLLAMATAGIPGQLPEVGGQLWMRWVGVISERLHAVSQQAIKGDRKMWEVRYERP
jgi:hypothetical protein